MSSRHFFIPWIILGWVVLGIVFFIMDSLYRIPFRYAWNYAEPVLAQAILNFPNNPLLYSNIHEAPYVLYPYTPLYAYLSYGVSLITGPNMASGRWVSFVSSLVLLWVMYRILRSQGTGKWISVIFPGLLVGLTSFTRYANVMQADVPAVLLSLVGVFFFRRNLILAIVFFTLAFLVKQNYVIGIVAAILSLWASRRFSESMFFILIQGVCIAFPLVFLLLATGGEAWDHIWTFHTAKGFDARLIPVYWKVYLKDFGILLGFAIYMFFQMIRQRNFNILFFYFALSLVKTIMLGKMGVDDNYFMDLTCVSIVLAATGMHNLLGHSRKIIGLGAWGLILIHLTLFSGPELWNISGREKAKEYEKSFNEFAPLLSGASGEIIAENMGILVGNNRNIVFSPFEFTQFAYAGVWDETPLIQRIKQGEFTYIVLSFDASRIRQTPRFTSRFLAAVRDHYTLLGMKHGQFFYIPN